MRQDRYRICLGVGTGPDDLYGGSMTIEIFASSRNKAELQRKKYLSALRESGLDLPSGDTPLQVLEDGKESWETRHTGYPGYRERKG